VTVFSADTCMRVCARLLVAADQTMLMLSTVC